MRAFIPISIPLLCAGVTFLVIGLSLGETTFAILGGTFAAVGLPMLVIGWTGPRTTRTPRGS